MSRAPGPGDRIVVVSPHLDDGVLSLGAAIARWTRTGSQLLVLTVLACDPRSAAPAVGWDRRAGFATEGEAARGRRDEDRAACAALGASFNWLPFGSGGYELHGDDSAVYDAVSTAVDGAHAVLIPGAPLTHADHAWLARVLVERPLPCERVGLYAEQPYRARSDAPLAESNELAPTVGAGPRFEGLAVGRRDRLAKLRAIRCYRSQLGLLALDRQGGWPLYRLLWDEARAGGEAVAWLEDER
jgi:LmbE family N-acetylglucosaminyl deacetylase